MSIKNVTIIGVGLIGGSLGMSIKDMDIAENVMGVSRNEDHLRLAVDKKAIDEGTTDMAAAVLEADLVVLATPIDAIIPALKKVVPYLKPGALVTDVGSTKQQIVEAAESLMPDGCYFVGGHPMAGSERSGIEAAHTFLFDNAVWVFTPTANTHLPALDDLKTFLGRLDIRPLILKPDIHDHVVAAISHLPYIAACSLVKVLANEKEFQKEMLALASSGFRDTTRVASSSPEWGKNISLVNKQAVLQSIANFRQTLQEIEQSIETGREEELLTLFASIQSFRTKIY